MRAEQKDEEEEMHDEDEDIRECCSWEEVRTIQRRYDLSSNEQLLNGIRLQRDRDVPFFGKPKYEYDDDTTYVEIVEEVMDDDWFDHQINCIISHATFYNDTARLNKMRNAGFGLNEASRNLLKGHYVIVGEISVHHLNVTNIHKCKEFTGNPSLAEVMPRWKLEFLEKHHRVTDIAELTDRDSPDFRPYQNIESGIDKLREKSVELWVLGTLPYSVRYAYT